MADLLRAPLADCCDHCGRATTQDTDGVLRCPCGSLIARRVPDGIELKCRRCKRVVVIPLQTEGGAPAG